MSGYLHTVKEAVRKVGKNHVIGGVKESLIECQGRKSRQAGIWTLLGNVEATKRCLCRDFVFSLQTPFISSTFYMHYVCICT